jgi:hypothetical protein
MNTFNEGDRVSHPVYGKGIVDDPYSGTGYATVLFENGNKVMADTSLLTPVTPASRFKAGDQVHHAHHGSATVIAVNEALKLVTIQPFAYRAGWTTQVHPISLTMESNGGKFKVGDRVSHKLHRDGTVEEIQANGLHVVNIGGNRVYMALEHQIEHAVPEPTYHICIEEITGAAHVPGSLTAKEVANYINDGVDWRVAKEITITKEG